MHWTRALLSAGLLVSAAAEALTTLEAPSCPTNSIQGGASPTRSIEGGTIIGQATSVVSGSATTTVYNYLGIPFAAKPTGSLRFAPPAPPSKLTQPLQATALPPACLQQFVGTEAAANFTKRIFNNPGGPPLEESEDCLYLNVWAPTSASLANKKPVLFWIFGGNLQFGSGSLVSYNGSSFAGFQDTVVVTSNYRTNIFGYSSSPELPLEQRNAGFLDQRAALKWVQENIASFGGDPERVTIFGESAGGASVKQLLANPPSPMMYHAAIMESQGSSLPTNSTPSYQNVVAKFNCSSSASPIDCLRKVPAEQIKQYISLNSVLFGPSEDNVTQSNDVRRNINAKRWASVPFFLGTNADEGRVFAVPFGLDKNPMAVTLKQALNATLLAGMDAAQDAVVNQYQDFQKSVNGSVYLTYARVITDVQFTCSAALLSNSAVAGGYSDVWRYYYNASFPNLQQFNNAGAYHSSEIPQVYGTYGVLGPATPDQEGLSKYMQTAWANFAKDPAAGPGWTKLNTSEKDLADLGGLDKTGETLISRDSTDQFCDFWNTALLNARGP